MRQPIWGIAFALAVLGCSGAGPDEDAAVEGMDAGVETDAGAIAEDAAPKPDAGVPPDGSTPDEDAGAADLDGAAADLDGATTDPDGGATDPDGGATDPDGGATDPDGGTLDPDGGTLDPDGGAIDLDGGAIDLDGGATDPDGGASDPDGGTPLGCNVMSGVECDGNWTGRCSPACAAGRCCAPVGGRFECVDRLASGACPAADIWVDTTQITGRTSTVWREFAAADCAIQEACVDAPGWRRLLLFDTWTPNTGTADLFLGQPADHPDLFEYSACHAHYHFNSYARYELRDATGAVVANGHKQAFCLLDFYRYPGEDERGLVYTCTNQGIQAGYQDVYGSYLDCQWVDVTDLPPGEYVLRIDLNYEGILLESDYTNNTAEILVTIPADDVTAPCPPGTPNGADRSCGLSASPTLACTPGASVELGCATRCGDSVACTGDPFLRVCEASAGMNCQGPNLLGQNDDHGCGGAGCGGGGGAGCCPHVTITCPASGEIVVFTGAYDPDAVATCELTP